MLDRSTRSFSVRVQRVLIVRQGVWYHFRQLSQHIQLIAFCWISCFIRHLPCSCWDISTTVQWLSRVHSLFLHWFAVQINCYYMVILRDAKDSTLDRAQHKAAKSQIANSRCHCLLSRIRNLIGIFSHIHIGLLSLCNSIRHHWRERDALTGESKIDSSASNRPPIALTLPVPHRWEITLEKTTEPRHENGKNNSKTAEISGAKITPALKASAASTVYVS